MGRPNSLPQFQSDDKDFQLMQNTWSSALTPILKNPLVTGVLVKDVAMINGNTVVNHKLGRMPQGWLMTDSNASVILYRSAAFNPLTITINSSGIAIVSLYVF